MIFKEFLRLSQNLPEGYSIGLKDGSDLYHWEALMLGPVIYSSYFRISSLLKEESPYKDGLFQLDIIFPEDYPFKPPVVKFLTKVYHPCVSEDGRICRRILDKYLWSPVLILANGKVISIFLNISCSVERYFGILKTGEFR